jgi:hypothetical protein
LSRALLADVRRSRQRWAFPVNPPKDGLSEITLRHEPEERAYA